MHLPNGAKEIMWNLCSLYAALKHSKLLNTQEGQIGIVIATMAHSNIQQLSLSRVVAVADFHCSNRGEIWVQHCLSGSKPLLMVIAQELV